MVRLILLIVSLSSLATFSLVAKKEVVAPEPVTISENKSFFEISEEDHFLLNVRFCEDTLPLLKPHVAKRYHNEVRNYNHPSFWSQKSRVEKTLKVIEPILAEYGIPSDLKYIPIVESGLDAEAISPKGAGGYWQFMPVTARSLGLTVSDSLDERKDLVKSTHAAARYLKKLHEQLGDWTLVAAAYNVGPSRLTMRMDQQSNYDYFDLKINSETAKYVYKLVAVKEWLNEPDRSRLWVNSEIFARCEKINQFISKAEGTI
jgi:hypothetical protein